jgi:hypothetical protein
VSKPLSDEKRKVALEAAVQYNSPQMGGDLETVVIAEQKYLQSRNRCQPVNHEIVVNHEIFIVAKRIPTNVRRIGPL